jgi:hypothetical protein
VDNKLCFEILDKFHKICTINNIKYHIHAGTLLGMVRDNGFIPFDYDIDVAVIKWDKEQIDKLHEELINNGFILHREFFYKDRLIQRSYLYNEIRLDVYLLFTNKEKSWKYAFYKVAGQPKNEMNVVIQILPLINEVEIKQIQGHYMSFPKNAIEILEMQYGENWEIPCKNWTYYKSRNAIPCEVTGYTKCYE